MKTPRFKIGGNIFLAVVGFAVGLAFAQTTSAATIYPATDPEVSSAFDYTGLTIINESHPQVNGSFDVRDMFGGNFGIGQAIFQDIAFSPTVYSVTFTLDAPVELVGYTLYLTNDGNDTSRALDRFQLLAGMTVLSDVIVSSTYDLVYGSHSIAIQDTFAPVTASTFTVRFYGGASEYNGVRVMALDAIAVPEPAASVLLLGAGTLALVLVRRRFRNA